MLTHLVNVVGEETRRAKMDLHDFAHALTPTAQAVPGEPRLAETAQAGADQAANRLENARRTVFGVVEGLPVLTRAVQEIPASDQQTLELDVTAPADHCFTAQLRSHRWATAPAAYERCSISRSPPGPVTAQSISIPTYERWGSPQSEESLPWHPMSRQETSQPSARSPTNQRFTR